MKRYNLRAKRSDGAFIVSIILAVVFTLAIWLVIIWQASKMFPQ